MRIVKREPKGDRLISKIRFNTHVESVSKMTEYMAIRTLYGYEGEKYFDSPVKGKCYITYPLSVVVEIDIDAKSTGQLLWQVAQAYKIIYDTEDDTSKVEANKIEGLLNRDFTDGVFGIWGHDMRDLYFESVAIYGNGIIDLGIGS